jgi:hypothetical protein
MIALALLTTLSFAQSLAPWGQVTTWTSTAAGDHPTRRPPDTFVAPVGRATVTVHIPGSPTGQTTSWVHIVGWSPVEGTVACSLPDVQVSASYAVSPWAAREGGSFPVEGPRLPLPHPDDAWPVLRLEFTSGRSARCDLTLVPHDGG